MHKGSNRSPLHQVAIVGAYTTKQAKKLDMAEIDVLIDAVICFFYGFICPAQRIEKEPGPEKAA